MGKQSLKIRTPPGKKASLNKEGALCHQPSGNLCRPEEYWTLPAYFWQLEKHVTHSIYKEPAAHSPLASLSSSTTMEHHCHREFQIKQREASLRADTQAQIRCCVLHSSTQFQEGSAQSPRMEA